MTKRERTRATGKTFEAWAVWSPTRGLAGTFEVEQQAIGFALFENASSKIPKTDPNRFIVKSCTVTIGQPKTK